LLLLLVLVVFVGWDRETDEEDEERNALPVAAPTGWLAFSDFWCS
jgi:hypothetical protein